MKEKHLQDSVKQSVKCPRAEGLRFGLPAFHKEVSNSVKVTHTILIASPQLIMQVFAVTQRLKRKQKQKIAFTLLFSF